MTSPKLTPEELDAFDTCRCGDYRSQHHRNGAGACQLNGLGHHGAPSCHQFVFSLAANVADAERVTGIRRRVATGEGGDGT